MSDTEARQDRPDTVSAAASVRWRRPALGGLFLLPLVAFVVLTFFPGLMIPDTLDMCNQAITGLYTNWHSPIFAGAWGFFDFSPGFLFVAQIVAFVAGIYMLVARWLKLWVAVLVTYVTTLVPTTLGWLPHIGKDEWSAVALLWAVVFLARSPSASGWRRWTFLAAALTSLWLAVAARTTAIVPVAVVLLFANWWFGHSTLHPFHPWPLLKRVGFVVAFVAFTLISQKLWIDDVVQPRVLYPDQPTLQFDLTALSLRTDTMRLPPSSLRPGATLESLKSHFSIHGTDALWFSKDAPLVFANPDPHAEQELRDAWLDAIRAHPDLYIRHRTAVALSLLGLSAPYAKGALWNTGSMPADFGLRCPLDRPYVSGLFDRVSNILEIADGWPIWRMWWLVLILIGAAVLAGLRRCSEARLLLVACLSTVLLFAALTTGPYPRYLWMVSVAVLPMIALAASQLPALRRDDEPSGDVIPRGDGVVTEHPDRGQGEVVEIPPDATDLAEQFVGHGDHVTADSVGLEDVQDLARAGPDELQSGEGGQDLDGGRHERDRVDAGVRDPSGEDRHEA
jgi:hypothetical protein